MRSRYFRPNGTVKYVKNLDWLLRRRQEVKAITIRKLPPGEDWEAHLTATLYDGTQYETPFASWELLQTFVAKRWQNYIVTQIEDRPRNSDDQDSRYLDNMSETPKAEGMRKIATAIINNDDSITRESLEATYGVGNVWDTDELRRDFEVVAFMAPCVEAIRKSDGKRGFLTFKHNPRFYFAFEPRR